MVTMTNGSCKLYLLNRSPTEGEDCFLSAFVLLELLAYLLPKQLAYLLPKLLAYLLLDLLV